MSTFFEGPEKKVELVVTPDAPDLRKLGRDFWEQVVRRARAEILSVQSSSEVDAYLLRESSLFVYRDHFIMITCGQTTLVEAVLAVVQRVRPDKVALLVYERKNEHFPREQRSTFFDDARRLRDLVPGRAFRFGDEHDHRIFVFHSSAPYEPDPNDTTLEILMHGIPENRGKRFHFDRLPSDDVAAHLGLDRLLKGFEIDEYAFSPVGFSLNAVREGFYYTIHVTPQEVGSYVSFETNFDFRDDPGDLVTKVVDHFAPESFDVLAFCPGTAMAPIDVERYRRRKHVHEDLCGYGIIFMQFYRPSSGPEPAFAIDL